MNHLPPEQRQMLIEDILKENVLCRQTLGTSIRRLRIEVTGFDQATFAKMCQMSTKALYQLENDKANPTINTLNNILNKFGMRMTLGAIVRDEVILSKSDHLALNTSLRGTNPIAAKNRALRKKEQRSNNNET